MQVRAGAQGRARRAGPALARGRRGESRGAGSGAARLAERDPPEQLDQPPAPRSKWTDLDNWTDLDSILKAGETVYQTGELLQTL